MYYKHSGRFTPFGVIVGVGTGTAAGLILAISYAYGIRVMPYDQLAALATLAFGALLGAAAAYGFIWGKVRNQAVAMAATGVISALALYLSWAVWVSVTLESQQISTVDWMNLSQHPRMLWDLICAINQEGTWSLDKQPTTKGTELWAIWFAEALAVVGGAILTQFEILKNHPFCENCDCWCTRGEKLLLNAPKNVGQLKWQLERKDLTGLESLAPGNKAANHLLATLDSCPQCRQLHTLTLTLSTLSQNWLRQTRITKKKIMEHLLIGPGPAEALRQISAKVAMTAKMPPASAKASAAGKK